MEVLLIISCVLINCAAQLFIKKGMLLVGEITMGNFTQSLMPMLTNIYLWLAMICYVVSFGLWMAILSKVEVSFAYPFLSIGYIFTAIFGYYLFGEDLSLTRIIGILVICIGVYLISRS